MWGEQQNLTPSLAGGQATGFTDCRIAIRDPLCYSSERSPEPHMPTAPTAAETTAAPTPKTAAKPAVKEDIYTALAAASATFPALTKDGINTYLKTKYLTLSNLLSMIRDPLLDVGCIITSAFEPLDGVPGMFVVKTTIRHMPSGTELSSSFPIADLSTQKAGAAATYGMRYNLMHILGRAADDDDDGAALANPVPQGYEGQLPQGQQRNAPAQMPQNNQVGAAWL